MPANAHSPLKIVVAQSILHLSEPIILKSLWYLTNKEFIAMHILLYAQEIMQKEVIQRQMKFLININKNLKKLNRTVNNLSCHFM